MTPRGPIAVLGLGLMGGSLARDLAARGDTVWGYDTDRSAVRAARRRGVIARAIDDDLTALRDAPVVVLAVPVDVAPALLERASPHVRNAALITDVGSTKRRIVHRATALGLGASFVGSHPLAGDHRTGWRASRTGLFTGARVDLCRSGQTSAAAWRRARALWRAVGARPVEHDAARHDVELAFTSHLPQLLSLGLAGALAGRGIPRARLGTGGRDMTRLAASSAEMWGAIFDENAEPVLDALDACLATFGALRGAVARHDRDALGEAFRAAKAWTDNEI
jgi:prephenate dehydrogenase